VSAPLASSKAIRETIPTGLDKNAFIEGFDYLVALDAQLSKIADEIMVSAWAVALAIKARIRTLFPVGPRTC
jgi:hypothetical protein